MITWFKISKIFLFEPAMCMRFWYFSGLSFFAMPDMRVFDI